MECNDGVEVLKSTGWSAPGHVRGAGTEMMGYISTTVLYIRLIAAVVGDATPVGCFAAATCSCILSLMNFLTTLSSFSVFPLQYNRSAEQHSWLHFADTVTYNNAFRYNRLFGSGRQVASWE